MSGGEGILAGSIQTVSLLYCRYLNSDQLMELVYALKAENLELKVQSTSDMQGLELNW